MNKHKQKGQAMLEYVIVIALVAIFCIPAFQALGNAVHSAAVESAQKVTNR